jgi:hypothetical protein
MLRAMLAMGENAYELGEFERPERHPDRAVRAPGESKAVPRTGARHKVEGARLQANPPARCANCAKTGRTCPSCVQRRRYAWSLVNERGETLEAAARIVNLPTERVRALVAEESNRRELESLRCNSIPVRLTQSVITDALARDPDLTIGEIAHWLDMRQADFERAYLGKGRGGRPKRRVNVGNASRLMIALGRAPNELEGC